jgi:hypothetical protein
MHRAGSVSAWQISETEFPYGSAPAELLRFLLRYAVLAPSPYNTQPWLFRIEGSTLEVVADRRRLLSCADPQRRQHLMSSGALLAALRLAARHFGHDTRVSLFPSSDVIATVALTSASGRDAGERSLFVTLPKRRRHVERFDPGVPSAELLRGLAGQATRAQAELSYPLTPRDKDALRAIATQAQTRRMADPAFRAELEQWLRPPSGSRCDGIPQEPEARPAALSALGAPEWVDPAELSAWARRFATVGQARAAGCPVLGVLATPGDTPQDWLAAGALILRLELTARACGVWLAEFPDAIELSDLRTQAGQIAQVSGRPQALLGLGYGAEVPPLPRRPVDDMLVRDHSPAFSMH